MEAPHAIASLPRPFDAEHGQTYATSVFSIKGSRKRKRHEVAVAVDGESVNVYNVQSQNLVISYALPPQSYLCTAPVSTYIRPAESASLPERRTYVVLRDGHKDAKRRLVCYSETAAATSRIVSDSASGVGKKELKLRPGEVVALDLAMSAGTTFILVAYRDGRVDSILGDLSGSLWQHDAKLGQDGVIEYATLLDLDSARKGLLAGREDVVAALDDGVASSRPLLFRIVRAPNGSRSVEAYSVRISTLQSSKAPLQLVLSYDLPVTKIVSIGDASYDLHASSGQLCQLLNGQLTVFDLSSTLPRVSTSFGDVNQPIDSFSRISTTSILTLSQGKGTVYETRYGSVQISGPVTQSSTIAIEGNKRKRLTQGDASNAPTSVKAAATFSDIGTTILLAGQDLLGLQLDLPSKRARRSRLLDVMGKGSEISLKTEKKAFELQKWQQHVDKAVESEDGHALEGFLIRALGLYARLPSRAVEDELSSNDSAYDDLFDLLLTGENIIDMSNMYRAKVLYLLHACFAPSMASSALTPQTLTARPYTSALFKWLALAGFLNAAYLENTNTVAVPGDIVSAISTIDPDFHLLFDLLALPVHWELEEVLTALRLLIRSFDTTPAATPPAEAETEVEEPSDLSIETTTAERELQHALSTLSTGGEHRSQTLRLVLGRLHTFPLKALTASMRKILAHRDLVFFIHVLRIELAEGGWTSRYIDGPAPTHDEDAAEAGPSDSAGRLIGDLLCCAVDAMGVSGWTVVLGEGAADLVGSLRAEVGAGLEGCLEARALGEWVREVEKVCGVEGEEVTGMLPLEGRRKVEGMRRKGRARAERVGVYAVERIRV